MNIIEEYGDLFELDFNKYYFAHCISSDAKMGKGIARDFDRIFNLKSRIGLSMIHKYPTTMLVDNVFNLITKEYYYNKPTYKSITQSIHIMKNYCMLMDIKYLAMPRIGSGLDKLDWNKVLDIIKEEFKDTNVNIVIRYKNN